jgi:hypothetical protein
VCDAYAIKSRKVLALVFIFGRCSIKWMRYSRNSWAGLVTRVRAELEHIYTSRPGADRTGEEHNLEL